jgi:signal peptidase I
MNEDKDRVKASKKLPEKKKSKLREYIEAIIFAILIALVITTFIVKTYKIPSGSMKPTLLVGDQIMVNKFIYGVKIPYFRKTIIPISDPQRGDIVVFIFPVDRSKDFIKRVIGLGGDTIEIKNKKIFINGKEYTDSFGVYTEEFIYPASVNPRDNFGPVTVPRGSIFVMGDNRDESLDSRFWGFVDLKDVEGKAFIIYWSWNKEDYSIRWQRLGKLLH